jgi:hypothetical protein
LSIELNKGLSALFKHCIQLKVNIFFLLI